MGGRDQLSRRQGRPAGLDAGCGADPAAAVAARAVAGEPVSAVPGRRLAGRRSALRLPAIPVGLLRVLWAVAAIALVWGAAAVHLVEERADALLGAQSDGAARAHAYAEAVLRTVREIDQTALLVRALDERGGPEPDLGSWLNAVDPAQRVPVQIAMTDRNGLMRISNLQKTTQRVDLSDRPHFRRFADAPEDVLHISPPVLGRVSKLWTLQFVRMLRTPAGGFNGIVVVSATPDALVRFVNVTDIGRGGTMTLLGLDGVVRAAVTEGAAGVVSGTPSPNPAAALAAAQDAGHFTWTDPQDGVTRIESFRRVAGLPLVVAVGLAENDVLAEFRADTWRAALASGAVTLVVLAASIAEARHRRRREQAQRALTIATENISQGLLMVDPDGRVAVMNRQLVDLLGLPPQVQPGSRVEDLMAWQVAAGEFDGRIEPPETAATLGRIANVTEAPPLYKRTRGNGTVLEVRTRVLADGAAVRTFSDVTAWEQAQTALQAARTAAEAGVQARTQFLAVMSHEIRTPLNGILGMAELLHESGLQPAQRDYTRTIRESGRHLLTLLNDILDFSKIDRGVIELETAPFEPAGLLETVRAMAAAQAEEKGLWLRVQVDPFVPARVCGDAHRLRQVLLNLVGNAIKFTRTGGIAVTLEAGRVAAGWRLDCRVRDSGIGIPAELQGRLFQEFTQADGSITRRFGGTGLGLAISHRLVTAMGGTIAVDSRDGEGAEFRFHVVVTEAPPQDPAAAEAPDAVGALTVLLAEDNRVNRLVATGILEALGHRVVAVEDGAAALAAVRRGVGGPASGDLVLPDLVLPDLVLMDVMMPVMDGLAATRAIRALPGPAGRIPVIGLTANAFREDEAACRAAGMDGFAPKPITRPRLAQEISRVWAACRPAPLPAQDAMDDRAAGPGTVAEAEPGAAAAAGPGSAQLDAARLDAAGIDPAVLDALADTLGEAALVEILGTFLADVGGQLDRMRALAETGTPEALVREAHALAGSAGTLGLRDLAAATRRLEQELRQTTVHDAARRVAAIAAMADTARNALAGQAGMPCRPDGAGAAEPAAADAS